MEEALRPTSEEDRQELPNPITGGVRVHEARQEKDDRLEAEAAATESTKDFSDLFRMSREQDLFLNNFAQGQMERSVPLDPHFQWNDELWSRVTKDVPEDYLDEFYNARSEREAWIIRARLQQQGYNEKEFANSGLKGASARLLANMLDETAIAATIATEGAAAPWVASAKVGRAAHILRGMAVGAGVEAGIAGALEYENPHLQDWKDAALAITIGGGFGALSGRALSKAAQKALEENGAAMNQALRDVAGDLLDSDIDEIAANDPGAFRHAGAAEAVSGPEAIRGVDNIGGYRPRTESRRKKLLQKLRFDDVGILLRSDNEVVRKYAPLIGEDSVGTGGEFVKEHSAALIQKTEVDRMLGKFRATSEPAWKEYVKVNGVSMRELYDGSARRRFMETVTEKVRRKAFDGSPEGRTAKALADNNREMLQMLKVAGREGFEDIEENMGYINRQWNTRAISEFNSRFGAKNTRKFLSKAIRSANREISDDVADKIAKALYSTLRKADVGLDGDKARLINKSLESDLEELLRGADVDADTISDIVAKISDAEKLTGKGQPTNARRRILLDETFEATFNGERVRISELFENNAEALHEMYIRQNMGHFALAKVGIKSDGDWNAMTKDILGWADDHGLDVKQAQKEIVRLEHLRTQILGRSTERDPHGKLANAARFARDLNFARLMGQVGFAQIAEAGVIAGQLGWRNLLAHSPMLFKFMRDMRTGNLKHPFLREWDQFIGGSGNDALLHVVGYRSDELGAGLGGGQLGHLADMGMQHAKKLVAHASLFHRMNAGLQNITAQGVGNKFLKLANKGFDNLTAAERRTLRDLGLTVADLKTVFAQIEKHSISRKGVTGADIQEFGLAKWDASAYDARDKLVYALNRYASRIIQRNFVGEGNMLLDGTVGKILGQFRGFMIHAHGKHLLHGLSMNQWETYASFMYSMLFGGMAYAVQTAANSVGREDQDKYLKKRLESRRLAAAAFQRAAFSSIIPAAWDTSSQLFVDEPTFAYGRSTGLATGLFTGNPTVDLVNKLYGTAGAAIKAPTRGDYKFSQKNFSDAWNLVPLSNAMGMRNINALIMSELPERSTKGYDFNRY